MNESGEIFMKIAVTHVRELNWATFGFYVTLKSGEGLATLI